MIYFVVRISFLCLNRLYAFTNIFARIFVMFCRVSTTFRPIITCALLEEISSQYLHEISSLTKSHEIPNELILNLDQTSSKFVLASNVTMTEKE